MSTDLVQETHEVKRNETERENQSQRGRRRETGRHMGEMIETCEMTGRILDQKETIEKIQEMSEIREM